MLIGITGKMGAGKTLCMSVLANFLGPRLKVPVFANYHLKNCEYINSISKIWQIESGIFCFDEIWLTMDSRLWKDNVKLTRWVNQTRKKRLVVFYTTQHISQVEMRVRKATDILIFCEKFGEQIWLNFIDYQYSQLGRRYLLDKISRFYSLYDTFEVLRPLAVYE